MSSQDNTETETKTDASASVECVPSRFMFFVGRPNTKVKNWEALGCCSDTDILSYDPRDKDEVGDNDNDNDSETDNNNDENDGSESKDDNPKYHSMKVEKLPKSGSESNLENEAISEVKAENNDNNNDSGNTANNDDANCSANITDNIGDAKNNSDSDNDNNTDNNNANADDTDDDSDSDSDSDSDIFSYDSDGFTQYNKKESYEDKVGRLSGVSPDHVVVTDGLCIRGDCNDDADYLIFCRKENSDLKDLYSLSDRKHPKSISVIRVSKNCDIRVSKRGADDVFIAERRFMGNRPLLFKQASCEVAVLSNSEPIVIGIYISAKIEEKLGHTKLSVLLEELLNLLGKVDIYVGRVTVTEYHFCPSMIIKMQAELLDLSKTIHKGKDLHNDIVSLEESICGLGRAVSRTRQSSEGDETPIRFSLYSIKSQLEVVAQALDKVRGDVNGIEDKPALRLLFRNVRLSEDRLLPLCKATQEFLAKRFGESYRIYHDEKIPRGEVVDHSVLWCNLKHCEEDENKLIASDIHYASWERGMPCFTEDGVYL